MIFQKKKLTESLSKILKIRVGIAQKDNKKLFEILSSFVSLKFEYFKSGQEHNGWVVPKHWDVDKADIWEGDKKVFDGKDHALAVGGSSHSFNGIINKEELLKKINFLKNKPNCYVYNPLNNLRPWQKKWSFSIPYGKFKRFGPGPFKINLKTNFTDNEMIIGTCFHKGESKETIVFNAHTCHVAQLNDGFSGIFLILSLFKWLQGKKTKYSYLGVFAPEHLGTIFYLSTKTKKWINNIKQVLFLESIASPGKLRIQNSFEDQAIINRFIQKAVFDTQGTCETKPFRTIIGNDETVWEAAGFDIPTPTLTRYPFETYHTDQDNIENFDFEKFYQTESICIDFIKMFESDKIVERNFNGLIALSNPKYNLYQDQPNPTINQNFTNNKLNWAMFQDYLFCMIREKNSIFTYAEASKLKFNDILKFFENLNEKKLVCLKDINSINTYKNLRNFKLPNHE